MRHRLLMLTFSGRCGLLCRSGRSPARRRPRRPFKPPAIDLHAAENAVGRSGSAGRVGQPLQRADGAARRTLATGKPTPTRRYGARNSRNNEPLCNTNDERCAKATVAELDRLRAYNSFWTPNDNVADNRTALIEDPADGRIPPMTPQAIEIQRAHVKAHPPTNGGDNDAPEIRHWTDYDLAERCIAAQVPTTTMGYNSAQYLMQSPGWVMLAHERLNTRIIPLDGRPHLPGTMGEWMGSSRGRWEGNTLVVETQGFTNKQSGGSVGRVCRRRHPLHQLPHGRVLRAGRHRTGSTTTSPSTIRRRGPGRGRSCSRGRRIGNCPTATTSDRSTTEPYQIYEYACHEGNNTVGNSMRGTIAARQREANRLPDAQLTKSLIGKTEAEIRADVRRAGGDRAGRGGHTRRRTASCCCSRSSRSGKVVRVRPEDLPLTDVVRNR